MNTPLGTEDPANPSPTPAAPAEVTPEPRRHRFLVGTLFALATIVGILAAHAVWINRQALNTDNWTTTSSRLLADKRIQDAVAGYAVSELFKSGEPQAQIKAALPTRLEALAGPVSSGLQQVAGTVAPRVLASSQVQSAWRQANRAAHATLSKIIDGGGSLASTNGGVVTLNLHAIVDQLGAALGVQSQVAAARSALGANAGKVKAGASKLGITLPPSSGQLVIMRSDQLKAAQDVAAAIKGLALVLPLIAAALFSLAVWLSRGRRRRALRTTGWCLVAIGLFVVLDRRVAGNYLLDALVKNSVDRPAADDVWSISTTLLYDIAAALVVFGLVFVAAAWLTGHTRPATAVRRALAPTLRARPAAGYIAVYAALLLLILWGPTPAMRQIPYILGLIVLLGLGVHALRRQTDEEFHDAQIGDTMRGIRAWSAGWRRPAVPDAPLTGGANGSRVAALERLAQLHDRGALTDTEFAAEKAGLINRP